ncbi:hypothetical protein KM043_008118 [Ampulex compressa]|nr:hypothetical protein KM043_008118 [Ampulex compressa]
MNISSNVVHKIELSRLRERGLTRNEEQTYGPIRGNSIKGALEQKYFEPSEIDPWRDPNYLPSNSVIYPGSTARFRSEVLDFSRAIIDLEIVERRIQREVSSTYASTALLKTFPAAPSTHPPLSGPPDASVGTQRPYLGFHEGRERPADLEEMFQPPGTVVTAGSADSSGLTAAAASSLVSSRGRTLLRGVLRSRKVAADSHLSDLHATSRTFYWRETLFEGDVYEREPELSSRCIAHVAPTGSERDARKIAGASLERGTKFHSLELARASQAIAPLRAAVARARNLRTLLGTHEDLGSISGDLGREAVDFEGKEIDPSENRRSNARGDFEGEEIDLSKNRGPNTRGRYLLLRCRLRLGVEVWRGRGGLTSRVQAAGRRVGGRGKVDEG